ncbi:MAG: phospho-sugar mutase [Pirellulaceae bacterium]
MTSPESQISAENDPRVAAALERVKEAAIAGKLSESAVENLRSWLIEPRYSLYRDRVLEHIDQDQWQKLDDVFWTIIPFGTGGRRGRMYEIGSNAINDRTIGESAQGLVNYITKRAGITGNLSCAIAYDTRHRSREFAELCAGIMVAGGFQVYFLDEYRATPQLSFAVRYKGCSCGIMVTASHNPPPDNAVKVYWSTGGQILPPHDKMIIEEVMSCQQIEQVDFAEALADGKVEICTEEVDEAYLQAALQCRFEGPRDARVLFSPLHGVGAFGTIPLLERDGFREVEVYEPHAEPSGDFPNVPGNVSNPENSAVFDKPIEYARANAFDVVLATDPDGDRMGCAAPLTTDPAGPWATLNGNQIGAVLADYVLARRAEQGTLSPDHYVVKTLVTSELIRKIAEHYGVRCEGNLPVGFKWIAGVMDKEGADKFVYGTEESHGFLVGQHVRDKDGPVACLLMSELIARLKAEGQSLHQYLDGLYKRHGYHREHLVNVALEGSEGMTVMKRLMTAFRTHPPENLGGMQVAQVRDYLNLQTKAIGGASTPLDGPQGDMVILDMAEKGNYVAIRPSGTEPKVKFYMFTMLNAADSQDLETARRTLDQRIQSLSRDVQAFADQL